MVKKGAYIASLWAVPLLLLACAPSLPPDRLTEGQAFPAIVLSDLNGAMTDLSDYRGKLVVLNVWATWCAPCREELPSLERLSQSLDPKRFVVIALAVDEDDHLVREYLIDKGISFTSYIDKDMVIVNEVLGITVVPDTFIIAPDGILLHRYVGPRDWHDTSVVKALEAAYRGESVADIL